MAATTAAAAAAPWHSTVGDAAGHSCCHPCCRLRAAAFRGTAVCRFRMLPSLPSLLSPSLLVASSLSSPLLLSLLPLLLLLLLLLLVALLVLLALLALLAGGNSSCFNILGELCGGSGGGGGGMLSGGMLNSRGRVGAEPFLCVAVLCGDARTRGDRDCWCSSTCLLARVLEHRVATLCLRSPTTNRRQRSCDTHAHEAQRHIERMVGERTGFTHTLETKKRQRRSRGHVPAPLAPPRPCRSPPPPHSHQASPPHSPPRLLAGPAPSPPPPRQADQV